MPCDLVSAQLLVVLHVYLLAPAHIQPRHLQQMGCQYVRMLASL